MKKILTFVLLALAALNAAAEKADANKETLINADSVDIDKVNQVSTASGTVVVTKGTLILTSDKAVIKNTPDDYMIVTLTSSGGKLATFRQKSDGGPDLWVEGQAQRIEYDERADMIKLFSNARIRRLEGSKQTELVESEFISYDSRKEAMVTRNDASGENKPGKGRATVRLAPRNPKPAAPAAGGAQ